MTVMVEKFGEPLTRVEVHLDGCPACEFARSALRNVGDVIFVQVHNRLWGLRRVECVHVDPWGFECEEVTVGEARAELTLAHQDVQ